MTGFGRDEDVEATESMLSFLRAGEYGFSLTKLSKSMMLSSIIASGLESLRQGLMGQGRGDASSGLFPLKNEVSSEKFKVIL